MKMRQFKRAKLAGMFYNLFGPWGPIGQWLVKEPVPLAAATEQVAVRTEKFVVQRVKDDEIVAEFDTREEALGLINKHFKQKKAKLYAMQNGEPVMFSEAEFA